MSRILVAVLFLALAPSCSRADVVTQHQSLPLRQDDWSDSVSFAPFDPSLGVLTSVVLDVRAHVDQAFKAVFTSPSNITLTGGPTSVVVGPWLTLVDPEVVRSGFGSWETVSFPGSVVDLFGSSNLPETVASSDFTVPVSSTSFDRFHSDSGNGGGTVLTSTSADLDLSYCYSPPCVPVPEPESLVLLAGMALSGIGWWICRLG